jgi:DNA-binding transcriptional regulator YhcF (GntR family)
MPWDLKPDRPIYTQLIEQIELMIISGIYPAGGKLPSVRDMAAEAAVNPNTMQRALSALESSGLLYSQRTSGRFVTKDAEKIAEVKQNFASDVIREFIDKMDRLGYTRTQVSSLLNDFLKEEGQNGKCR